MKKFNILVILISLIFIIVHIFVFSQSNLENYPYIHYDFWKRFHDAQYFAGLGDIVAFHPPFPSILMALWIRVFSADSLYLLYLIIFVLGAVGLYRLAAYLSNNKYIAFFSFCFFLFTASNYYFGIQLGLADIICVVISIYSINLYLAYKSKNKTLLLIMSALLCGLAGITQYVGFATLLVIAVDFYHNSKFNNYKKFLMVVTVTLLPIILFNIYKLLDSGNIAYSKVGYFDFLSLHLEDIPFYFWQSIVYFTPFLIIFSLYGARLRANLTNWKLVVLNFAIMFGFFSFFYTWEDDRFITYIAPVIFIFAALGLYHLLIKINQNKKFISSLILLFLLAYISLVNFGNKTWIPVVGPLYITADFEKGLPGKDTKIVRLENKGIPTMSYLLTIFDYESYMIKNQEIRYHTFDNSFKEVRETLRFLNKESINNQNIILYFEENDHLRYIQFTAGAATDLYHYNTWEYPFDQEQIDKFKSSRFFESDQEHKIRDIRQVSDFDYIVTDGKLDKENFNENEYTEIYSNRLYMVFKKNLIP